MKLAFSGQARYPDFTVGYDRYVRGTRGRDTMSEDAYRRVVKSYCKILARQIEDNGFAELPANMGTIVTATLTRKPQYRGKTFIGYGGYDWEKKQFDGKLNTFGIVYLPKHGVNDCLRCYGFVANRQLFKRLKEKYTSGECNWVPLEFNDSMI